jgi:hypothetical protein
MHSGRRLIAIPVLFVLVVLLPSTGPGSQGNQFTPVIASALTANTQPFPDTDGRCNITYELVLTNTMPRAATLEKVEVLEARSPSTAVAAYKALNCCPT